MYQLVGVQSVDYVSKKSGNPVKGVNLHCLVLDKLANLDGSGVERLFISANGNAFEQVNALKIGCKFSCYFNKWGNVDSIVKED